MTLSLNAIVGVITNDTYYKLYLLVTTPTRAKKIPDLQVAENMYRNQHLHLCYVG